LQKEHPTPNGAGYSDWRNAVKDTTNLSRRNILKFGGLAIAMVPVLAFAAKNDSMRTSMKYKDTPEGDKQCSGCVQFVPGAGANDAGGCKIFPGDTEIAPKGYCVAWVKK
jgi:hypothetical protein